MDCLVVDYQGRTHAFVEEAAALRFALGEAWTDKPTTVYDADGKAYLIVRRDDKIKLTASRIL